MFWVKRSIPPRKGIGIPDVVAVMLILSFFVGMIVVVSHWVDPLRSVKPLDLSLFSLPMATFLSVSRIVIAYFLSLIFSITIGYWAAHSRSAERFLIPIIDILQSIPVLGFLPGVVLFLTALFPSTRIGLELAAIVMIFTGMAWNLTLSFYGSLRSIPEEHKELIRCFGYRPLGALIRLEIPYAMNGLVWNSMLSVAGGWFFLTICESFTMGDSSFQLIGLGSYMALAADRGDLSAIVSGFALMVGILVFADWLIWRPLLRWAERFKQSTLEEDLEVEEEIFISFFASSKRITRFIRRLRRYYSTFFFSTPQVTKPPLLSKKFRSTLYTIIFGIALCICAWGMYQSVAMAYHIAWSEWLYIFECAAWSFLRVFCVLVLCMLTMVPIGLWIGSQPRIMRRFQPIIQVAAAFPAPMIFPVITSIILYFSIPMSVGSVFLMMMGAQWYVLFNVLAGTSAVPRDYVDQARISGMSYLQILRRVYFPAAFPQIVTGLLTAAGGAWNTSIVAELVVFRGQEYLSPGLGSYIAKAAGDEKFAELVAAVFVMVILIVLVNRFVWARLYNLSEAKFQL